MGVKGAGCPATLSIAAPVAIFIPPCRPICSHPRHPIYSPCRPIHSRPGRHNHSRPGCPINGRLGRPIYSPPASLSKAVAHGPSDKIARELTGTEL
eukprot:scaffold3094_cov124-Isochrysis_galbana.AAC.1